jgi:hypothetical protein
MHYAKRQLLTLLTANILCWLTGATTFADDRVDYLRSVKPLLTARCYTCHGALKQKSGLRLDTVELMKKGGDNGAILVPGKLTESPLLARISSTGADRMPPRSEGEPLKASEIALIRKWIEQGATGPADEKPEADPKDHWSFKPIRRPVVPTIRNPQFTIRNPIDAFIAVEQEKRGLIPQRPAERAVLLRRAYIDLIGLPPTRQEQADFLADNSPDAYERVVDRLLASKQYGERWGRHWMDVWRYSDWWGLGAEVRNSQKHIWHWRDWLIESLNADKGYDQMLREMLAADELYPADLDRLRATGFLVRSYFIFNRTTWLDEVVEHTSKAFLGLTFNCTKCHDHKYDPIAQKDYYQFRGFFEPYQVRMDMVPGESDLTKDGLPRVFDCNLDAPTYLHVRGDEKQAVKTKPLSPGVPALLSLGELNIKPVALPPEAHNPGLRSYVLDNHLKAADRQLLIARASLEQARKRLAELEKIPPPVPVPPAPGKGMVQEDFTKPRPELWEMKAGRWVHKPGKLVQEQDGATRGILHLKTAPPGDFEARLKFTILGGKMWKSVGLLFDVAGDNEQLVYLSAVEGGSKLQIAYKQGTDYVYPPGGMQARPVKVNEPQVMTICLRGNLVNVAVNGQHALAYQLPLARRPGALALITYDASAEFTAFELKPLSADVKLLDAGTPGAAPVGPPTTVEQARRAVTSAEKALAVAEASRGAIRARAAADRTRQPSTAREAARAEKALAVALADEALVREEQGKDEKKIAAARMSLAAARKALENPGESYTPLSLSGSLKTPESNLETPASRNKPYPTTSTGRRSALSAWITDNRHPLTARVAVNHIWMRHMGKPLVPTVFDFGRKGTPPTHPDLLDWLASELVQNGWSMKHLHRLIVTSNTYRLSSSSANAENAVKVDSENRWYWRMNPIRMESQVIRDSLLHLSGDLDTTIGGPTVPAADETTRRRSLYFFHSHNDYNKFLSTFDDANVLECYRRAESIVPAQTLALENSKLVLVAADRIARRLNDIAADAAFIRAAFETVLGTPPSADEQTECETALKELREIAMREKKPEAALRARANVVHALLNHNDFVTIR